MCKAQAKIVQDLQQHQNSKMGPKKLKITPKYPKIKLSETKNFSNRKLLVSQKLARTVVFIASLVFLAKIC